MQAAFGELLRDGFEWAFEQYPELMFSLYPPYLGAGIEVVDVADDFRRVEVQMPLRWYNQNYVGTQFGGSLYSMCDPFYMMMVIFNLGDAYVVWDKAADIQFRRPGRGRVSTTLTLSEDELDTIRREVAGEGVAEPCFDVEIVDESGEIVAEITKTLHVRRED